MALIRLVLGTFRNNRIRLVHHSLFDGQPLLRKAVGVALIDQPHPSQGVKRDDERQAERRLQVAGHQTRHEEVRVNEIVLSVNLDEFQHLTKEIVHPRQQLFLGRETPRAGVHMNDPQTAPLVGDGWQGRIVAPRENVNLMTHAGQMPGDTRHVDVLAPAIDAAQRPDGRGMLTDECYAFRHGASSR